MDDAAAVSEVLDARPELESPLREVLNVDEEYDSWTFDDVPVDSGVFGELVSRGLIEKTDDGEYAVADREAVRRALDAEETGASDWRDSVEGGTARDVVESISVPDLPVDRPVAVFGLAASLALVVLFRVLPWPAVFRGEDIVLSGNDPYAYRYWIHQLVEASTGLFDVSVLSSLPGGVPNGEPLMVVTLGWTSLLFGGTSAVGGVLAWYPVVSAVVTAVLVYALAVRVTDDRRVGIAAVALLAVIPGHAFRTGLGFADHHAFDYPWLALTVLAVVSLVADEARDRRTWMWGVVLGIGVAGQILAWDAGPLLVVPLGLFAATVVPSWVRAGQSPADKGMVFVSGLGLAAVVVLSVHLQWGWHTRVVAVAPLLLFGGTIVVVGLGEAARWFEVPPRLLLGVETLVGVGGIVVLGTVFPEFVDDLERGVDFLISTGGIAETMSIISGDLGTLIGPIFLFGFALFLAVPYFTWASWQSYRGHEPVWLATSLYAWWFLALSVIQIRFAGQLALFTAVFGGLGFVHLVAWVDLTTVPRPFGYRSDGSGQHGLSSGEESSTERGDLEWPERRRAISILGLGLGTGSLGILNTPIKHSQLIIDESMYEAARFMREYSEDHDWEYPENYVFSEWGRNRVYNWFVNGQARGYGYARNNFREFIETTDSQEWYERLRNRVGFVAVVDQASVGTGGRTLYERLRGDNFGVETGHFRAVWAADDDSRRVYTLVPGARVTGPGQRGEPVSVDGDCAIAGRELTVSTEFPSGENGVYDTRIPLPGQYTIGDREIEISEVDVIGGVSRSTFDAEGYAYWPFDEGSGGIAYDRTGTNHAQIHGAEWTDEGRDGPALSFGDDESYVEAPIESLQEFTISLWAYPTALDVSQENDFRDVVRAKGGSILVFEQSGGISFRLPGADVERLVGGSVSLEEWTHVTVTFDGSVRTVYVDGDRRTQDEVSVDELTWGESIRIGNRFPASSQHGFTGVIDAVRVSGRAMSDSEIGSLFDAVNSKIIN